MKIYRHKSGQFIAGSKTDIENLMESNSWPVADCEDVSTHPVISRQLSALRAADANGFCELTDRAFTAQELAEALVSNKIELLSELTKDELAGLYVKKIGYNPFSDSPTITEDEVRKTLAEYLSEV